jgi:putative tryptophan/tyrosine transport system substrate-binding protein
MQRKIGFWLLTMVLLNTAPPAQAQQVKKVARIGYSAGTSPGENNEEAFRQGLRGLGYVEGQNIVIEWRYAEGKPERTPEFLAELVRLNVDVIVTGGPTDTRAAKAATSTIPIVMTNESDPVGNSFVASLARPGGNITGLATLTAELDGKRLELLKETIPRLSHVVDLRGPGIPRSVAIQKDTEAAARSLGIKLQFEVVKDPNDTNRALEAIIKARTGALSVTAGPFATAQRKQLVEFAAKHRLPAIYYRRDLVEDGGFMSYATSRDDLARRAAIFVDKILKGAKPADLPVEQPTKFEFVINLKAAKQIGLTIPPSVLYRADKVIK